MNDVWMVEWNTGRNEEATWCIVVVVHHDFSSLRVVVIVDDENCVTNNIRAHIICIELTT